jgi:hypothetical protein
MNQKESNMIGKHFDFLQRISIILRSGGFQNLQPDKVPEMIWYTDKNLGSHRIILGYRKLKDLWEIE